MGAAGRRGGPSRRRRWPARHTAWHAREPKQTRAWPARYARLVDVSAKTVERWEQQQALPPRANSRVRIQLAQIQEIRDLGLCVYTPEGFRQFLRTPLPVFDGSTPLQMIEQGKAKDVLAALASDYEGLDH